MKDPKTTIAGVVAAIALFSKSFGLEIPEAVTNGVVAIAIFAMSFFAQDSK